MRRVDDHPLRGERRLVAREVLPDRRARHPPGSGGVGAERLDVDEVAPPADRLREDEPADREVGHGQELHLPPAADEAAHEKSADHAAVDGDAALPEVEDADRVVRVDLPAEDHVVEARADDPADDRADDDVEHPVGVEAEGAGALQDIEDREQEPRRDDDAVPADRPVDAGDRKGGLVDLKLPDAKPREGDRVPVKVHAVSLPR